MSDRQLFEDARRQVEVQDLVKDLVVKVGSQWRGQCPLCHVSKAKSPNGQFAIKPDKGTWRCFGCGEFGDVVDLCGRLERLTPVEAAHRLLGSAPPSAKAVEKLEKAKEPEGPSASDKMALEIWRGVKPFAGSPAETYLLERGIDPRVLAAAAPMLRFHPNVRWGRDEESGKVIRAPALVVPVVVQGEDGRRVWTGGVHCTFLSKNGKTKANLTPAKRMFGPQHIGGKPGGAVLILPTATIEGDQGDLAAGEGIETVLSVVSLHLRQHGVMLGAMAALSLDRLQGGLLRDNEGAIDPYDPKANPERPAFVWRGPRALALIAVDRDMSPLRVKARTPRGRTCDFTLEAEARARLCSRLAAAAWKAAGAKEAKAIAPSPGCDFNDELRRVLAAEKRRA